MKILVLIPVWKRPEILKLMVERLSGPDYAELIPMFILSPEDPYIKTVEKLTAGFGRVYYSNEYLSDKLNAGLLHAMNYEWDYLMGLGSDNVFTDNLWALYRPMFDSGKKYFSINEFHVWDVNGGRAAHFCKYVDEPELGGIGAGRMIHRSILEGDPCIYKPKTSCGMDGFSSWHLYKSGFLQEVLPTLGADVPLMLDIKTLTNVNLPLEIWGDRNLDVDVEWIKRMYGFTEIMSAEDLDLINLDKFHESVCKLSQVMPTRDAFNSVNVRYEYVYGNKRYASVESYWSVISRKFNKDV